MTPPLANSTTQLPDFKYKMVGGIPMLNTNPTPVNEEEVQLCSVKLRNISKAESQRSKRIGKTLLSIATIMAALFVYYDKKIPRYYRLVINIPFGFGVGMWLRGNAGI
jgi:hypothetical protein